MFAVHETAGPWKVHGRLIGKNLVPALSLPSWALTIPLSFFVDSGASSSEGH